MRWGFAQRSMQGGRIIYTSYAEDVHARLMGAAMLAGIKADAVAGVAPSDVLVVDAVVLARRCGADYAEIFAMRASA